MHTFFRYSLNAPGEDWLVKHGMVCAICDQYNLSKTRKQVYLVIYAVQKCIQEGKEYHGYTDRNWSRNITISSHPKEEHIIADWMEQDLCFRRTTMVVDHYRREEGKNVVMFAFHRMMPTITRIKNQSQRNINYKAWKLTSYRQTLQINIMLGQITLEDLQSHFSNFPSPHITTHTFSPRLPINKSYFFDEVHVKQEGGSFIHDKLQILFPRDHTTGNYNPTSTTIATKEHTTTFKYSQQAQFCLGITKVCLLNNAIEGRKCKVFDYTSKLIVTITDYNKKFK